MATTEENLGGLLKGLGLVRDEHENLRRKQSESSTDSGTGTNSGTGTTLLDVYSYACSAKPGDTDYDIKIEIANQIDEDYQKYNNSKKDKLLTIIKYLSNIKEQDITIEDQKLFKSIILGLQEMDKQNGNYMLTLFEKHPNLVDKFAQAVKSAQTTMSDNAKPTTSDNAKPTTSDNSQITTSDNAKNTRKRWRGGNYLSQKGGRVGPFESLKSLLSLDDYWKIPFTHSSLSKIVYKDGFGTFGNIVDKIFSASVPSFDKMKHFISVNESWYLDEHYDIDMIRDIIRLLYYTCKSVFLGTYFFTWMPLEGIFKLIQGTTSVAIFIPCYAPFIALELVEVYSIKPALLAIDLPASAIASLFRNAGSVAVAEYIVSTGEPIDNNGDGKLTVAENNGSTGGSKKTRHRKKNTKKNKKRKQRNTNRK